MTLKQTDGLDVSFEEMGERLGVTKQSISDAIGKGQMTAGVSIDQRGRAHISDANAFEKQWRELRALDDVVLPEGVPQLAESKARREAALAALAERELARDKGKFIDVEKARFDLRNFLTIVRNRLLGVPYKVVAELMHGRPADDARKIGEKVDELIREALEELADGGGDEADRIIERNRTGEADA